MEAALFKESSVTLPRHSGSELTGKLINAIEFRQLLISHRRLVRADQRSHRLKGLHDLDTGEVFLIDERRLLEASH